MKVQGNQSFCGKVVYPDGKVSGIGHLVTRRAMNVMRVAPTGATLSAKPGRLPGRFSVTFAYSNITKTIRGMLTEESVISLIRRGVASVRLCDAVRHAPLIRLTS